MLYILNIYSGTKQQGIKADIRTKPKGRTKTDLTPLPMPQTRLVNIGEVWHKELLGIRAGIREYIYSSVKPTIVRQSGVKPVSTALDTLIKGRVRLGEQFMHTFKGKHQFDKLSTSVKKQIKRDLLSLQKANVRQVYISLSFRGEVLFQGNVSTKTLMSRLTELYLYQKALNL